MGNRYYYFIDKIILFIFVTGKWVGPVPGGATTKAPSIEVTTNNKINSSIS